MKISPDTGTIKRTVAVARSVASSLAQFKGWSQTVARFVQNSQRHGCYGWVEVATFDLERICFSIYLDRVETGKPRGKPILSACFEAEGRVGHALVRHVAPLVGAPTRVYGSHPHQQGRSLGYGGATVLEREPDQSRAYLCCYYPDDGAIALAADAFASFFRQWRRSIEGVPLIANSQRTPSLSSPEKQAIAGLAAELAVLSQLPKAEWLGTGMGSYDLRYKKWTIEVKSAAASAAPILALSQIRAGITQRNQRFAVVTPKSTRKPPASRLRAAKALVEANYDEACLYLQKRGVTANSRLMDDVAERMANTTTRFYRLRAPEGWATALRSIERFGPVRDLAQQCPVDDWFEEVTKPR